MRCFIVLRGLLNLPASPPSNGSTATSPCRWRAKSKQRNAASAMSGERPYRALNSGFDSIFMRSVPPFTNSYCLPVISCAKSPSIPNNCFVLQSSFPTNHNSDTRLTYSSDPTNLLFADTRRSDAFPPKDTHKISSLHSPASTSQNGAPAPVASTAIFVGVILRF